jgi:glycosyltransferase involved in cell wall biosynthesis
VHPEKGLDLLVDGFARFRASHPGWSLRIVGPWDTARGGGGEAYAETLRRRATAAGGGIELAGPEFDPHRLAAAYARASLFAYPSLAETGETFGLAALEAMAQGLPAVVSDLGCFRDFVKEGVNGSLFDHRSADAPGSLATALAGIADRGPEGLRPAARETAAAYTPSAIAQLHLADFT